jgi:hypothetical protein
MGLLSKAISRNNAAASKNIQAVVADFYDKNMAFHCIVLQGKSQDIVDMVADHGAACADLSGGNCLVLLPGGLDMELFSHRLFNSTGLAVQCQFNANMPSVALEKLNPYLR